MKFNLVDFNDDDVLNVHLNLAGVANNTKNRETLRVMGKELALLFGKEKIRHRELEAYVSRPVNMVRLM
ncbi:hypothetical protein CGH72_08530 [Vibrio parahaemolyticus]|uniref:hypothetical protein n=1 Tax=Vibrio TaxID=662 RepID=UPI0005EDBF07|nr:MULTISPECIES: hypothetical protein [Vibrio]TOK04622.1 hypothetical protein CGI25_22370 [Vibrio parahaemolyticus]TOM58935.1 hypothetical protein CGH75_11390 [Vibrio parahaemolyticus]TOM64763.1 hypothetical protein CGH73_20960 [Vibrio parahaemolyticus]TOM73413.1 hypothetical protein CGH72_08530 [Vibrio parahaemolyticus]TOO81898.1 hypothetical protein CGH29_21145 [Vibrio parahaemolyticus]